MIRDLLALSPILLMLMGAVLLMAGLVVGIEWPWIAQSSRRLISRLVGWCRHTCTAAGDHPPCRCDRVHVEVFCPVCRHVRILTPTSTLSSADSNVLLGNFEDGQRRQQARVAFDEIELDLDEQAVN